MHRTYLCRERRRNRRVAVDSAARLRSDSGGVRECRIVDVDHAGVQINAPDSLVPGAFVVLEVPMGRQRDSVIELKGRVAWALGGATPDRGIAGVRIYHDEEDAQLVLCALMCAGLKRAAGIAAMRDRHFIYAEWKLAALAASEAAASTRTWRDRATVSLRNALAGAGAV